MSIFPIMEKWESFGWNVIEIDGHNIKNIFEAYTKAKSVKGKPTLIFAHTIKGKGVSFMENTIAWHWGNLDEELRDKVLAELESKRAAGGAHHG